MHKSVKENLLSNNFVFEQFKLNILNLCPVAFCENNLSLDGREFRLNGNGYKPFADIYRYIGLKAIEPNTKPVVLVKGRQIGATTMAAALECYFMACGLYGNNGRSPMRIMHLFPTLAMAAAYTKDKLHPMISASKSVPGQLKSNGQLKSLMETKMDTSSPANNSQHFKKFWDDNQIWIESTGPDGNRVRGRTIDCALFDECFPYEQNIEIESGKKKIGTLYDMWVSGKELPLVKTYNESTDQFEYKKILKAWKHGERKLVQVVCGSRKTKCTPNHRFLTANDGWKQAKDLVGGDLIGTPYNNYIITCVEDVDEKEIVYDIEVEDNHNFIVNHLIAHNCQDIPAIAVGAVTKTLAQAQYGHRGQGVQVYFGTPKQRGSWYYEMWKKSTQQYYHLHCESCDQYFPLYRPDVNWEDIWLYGFIVKCTNCGHEQHKNEAAERGKWFSLQADEDSEYLGYHINQLYIPRFDKETILKQKPENSAINTERIYQNEVLGEFYAGEGATIVPDDIHENCADRGRCFAPRITPQDNRRVYAGFDWGQRGDWNQLAGRQKGQSYSCGVVLTAIGPQLLQIEFAHRLKRTDLEHKIEVVEEMFRRFNVHLGIGDIGDAADLTHILQRKHGDRFLASRAAPKVNKHIKYTHDIFPKEIVFERDYYISELMGLLKNGNIRFPYGNYEEITWLIEHCCSMEIKITQDRAGDPVRRYAKGPTPNDGFMALLNAYIAYKFDITQGFKINKPAFMKFENATMKNRIPAVVGYVPKL